MANGAESLSVRLSPTFLTTFLGCNVSAAWTLEQRRGLRPALVTVDDPQTALIVRKGHEHEVACLAALRTRYGEPVVIQSGPHATRMAETILAMDRGAPVICQAALADQIWIGYADFLVRVDEPCPRWKWSYEPWDAKLARRARPEHVIQIAIYSDLLRCVQGRAAERGALMLGTSKPDVPYSVEIFRLDDVRHYVRRAARRFEAFADNTPTSLSPEPCGYCGKCDWLDTCEDCWEQADHLCRVADIRREQMRHLFTAGVSSVALLSQLGEQRVPGIGTGTLAKLVQQARLQKQSAETGLGASEVLPHLPGFGFDRLPQPDPSDLFFDFDGDPMYPGGLEYLCGVLWRAEADDKEGEAVPGHRDLRFLAVWAHDRDEEKQAFQRLMDFLVRRLSVAPGAHLYHYGSLREDSAAAARLHARRC